MECQKYKRIYRWICDEELYGFVIAYESKEYKYEFKILIDNTLNIGITEKISTLFHEYAHVLQMHVPDSKLMSKEHCGLWQVHYNRITKAWKEHVPRSKLL